MTSGKKEFSKNHIGGGSSTIHFRWLRSEPGFKYSKKHNWVTDSWWGVWRGRGSNSDGRGQPFSTYTAGYRLGTHEGLGDGDS